MELSFEHDYITLRGRDRFGSHDEIARFRVADKPSTRCVHLVFTRTLQHCSVEVTAEFRGRLVVDTGSGNDSSHRSGGALPFGVIYGIWSNGEEAPHHDMGEFVALPDHSRVSPLSPAAIPPQLSIPPFATKPHKEKRRRRARRRSKKSPDQSRREEYLMPSAKARVLMESDLPSPSPKAGERRKGRNKGCRSRSSIFYTPYFSVVLCSS